MAEKLTPKNKVAFISVYDKTGLDVLASTLVNEYGYTLLSTGGTYAHLREYDIPVIESTDVTGFGELAGGRVKSLHPHIFAGILSPTTDDTSIPFFIDLVIANLYPFEAKLNEPGFRDSDALIELIDVGGPSLLRAAAKNYNRVNVLSSPDQYAAFLEALKNHDGQTPLDYRQGLAAKVFARTAAYDTTIARFFEEETTVQTDLLPDKLALNLVKIYPLRYGENPHQQASYYGTRPGQTVDFTLHHGKPLSYNNILDMESAWHLVCEFEETPACAIIKHNNPCGVAMAPQSLAYAFQSAFDADPISAFGGVVAFNRPVDLKTAEKLKDIFLEVIVAPGFQPDALALLSDKKNLRLVEKPWVPAAMLESGLTYRQVSPDTFLVQTLDPKHPTQLEELLHVVTQTQPSKEDLDDMLFAWRIVKHVKSNAMVLAKDGKTLGIGAGQTSRIGALEIAIAQACDEAKDAVLASDGFLPQVDNIHAAAQARIKSIIQPGGSIKDKDVIAEADRYEIAMVTTGIREFKH